MLPKAKSYTPPSVSPSSRGAGTSASEATRSSKTNSQNPFGRVPLPWTHIARRCLAVGSPPPFRRNTW